MNTSESLETAHVTNISVVADIISAALRLQGREAAVIALPGNFSVGPIDPIDRHARQGWLRTVLRSDPEYEQSFEHREDDEPWIAATSGSVHPVYWVCLANACEHASFLLFVERMAGKPFDIIDATDLDLVEASGFNVTQRGIQTIPGLGALRPEDIVASGLEARRRPFTPAESEAARAVWARLRRENAPLRVMQNGELVSAPLTHFDAFLTGQATPEWEKAGYLIGRTMVHLSQEIKPPVHCPSDTVLFGRLLALGESGELDVSGPGPSMRDYRVRAPSDTRV